MEPSPVGWQVHPDVPTLSGALFAAAEAFGLTDEEVWQAAVDVSARAPDHKPAIECIDEVADELAQRLQPKLQPNGR
jgi:hypothetical protein